jgi:hypothetical protein
LAMNKNKIKKTALILGFIGLIIFSVGNTFAQRDSMNPATSLKLIIHETINLSEPVKSADELVVALSDSLNYVCENLNLTIKNTGQWFNKQMFEQCIDQANSNSQFIGPYYKGYNYTYTTGNRQLIKMNIHFNYRFPRKTLIRYLNEAESKATNILNTIIIPDMDDYQKEIALHDYIIQHASYDDLNYRKNTVPAESYTPYGILIRGIGVCSGYAYTMKYLCDKAGLESIVVSGKGDGGDHAWNIIKVEGKYYHVDATWDDPVGKERLRYYYFNLNDEMMAINHSWNRNHYPKCTATEYNYYRLNDLWVANMEECKERIENTIARHEETVQMQVGDFSLSTFQKTLKNTVSSQNFYGRYSYSYDDKLGIVEIKFQYSD